MGVSKDRGNPKSSNLIGFSIINHPFWGTIICGNTHVETPEELREKNNNYKVGPKPIVINRRVITLINDLTNE